MIGGRSNYLEEIRSAESDPEQMELLYQSVRQASEEAAFQQALFQLYDENPDNQLYTAWYHRLQHPKSAAQTAPGRAANWTLAIPLGIANGLLFWLLSAESFALREHLPTLLLIWAPLSTFFALAFLTITPKRSYRLAILVGIGIVAVCAYVILITGIQERLFYRQYLELMAIHLPLLSWAGIGLVMIGLHSSACSRFAFLIKSLETIITAGLFLIAGIAFGLITVGMFKMLGVNLPDVILRLIAVGGVGLLPTLAVATTYDPNASPKEQDFQQGLSRFIFIIMRLLLPLTLVIMSIYIFFIPFHFMQPFQNRDALIVSNVMLFAVMGLLIGVTPLHTEDLPPRFQTALRKGIIAVAMIAALVSLYTMAAVVYRTVLGGLTINRTAVIGWNSINISLLVMLIYRQLRYGRENWIKYMHDVFRVGINTYLAWALLMIIAIPLLFH